MINGIGSRETIIRMTKMVHIYIPKIEIESRFKQLKARGDGDNGTPKSQFD